MANDSRFIAMATSSALFLAYILDLTASLAKLINVGNNSFAAEKNILIFYYFPGLLGIMIPTLFI